MARPPDLGALLSNIVERVQGRATAAVLDLGATIDELLAVPGATPEAVYRALAGATSPVAAQASKSTLSAMRGTVSTATGRELAAIQREVYEAEGVPDGWTWVSVLDERTCDEGLGPGGCSQRHGMTFSAEELADIGEPGAGGTVCRGNCRCVIVPARAAAPGGKLRPELKDPIVRPRRKGGKS